IERPQAVARHAVATTCARAALARSSLPGPAPTAVPRQGRAIAAGGAGAPGISGVHDIGPADKGLASGIRASDAVAWAREILAKYGDPPSGSRKDDSPGRARLLLAARETVTPPTSLRLSTKRSWRSRDSNPGPSGPL